MNASLEVVYVLSNGPGVKNLFDVSTLADHSLKQYVSRLKLGPQVGSHLIVEKSTSRKKATEALVSYARKRAAEMIILTSHGKQPLGRLALGGFANLLVSESPVPVLFLASKKNPIRWANRILFPTDFSSGSRLAFSKLLNQFKDVDPEIIIFHVMSPSLLTYSTFSYAPYMPESYWSKLAENARKEGGLWIKDAEAAGLRAKFVLDEKSIFVKKAIEKAAKKNRVGMIALASVSNRIRLRVFGSVAAQLFQLRTFPTWVCGPEAIREEFSLLEGATPTLLPETKPSAFDDLWL